MFKWEHISSMDVFFWVGGRGVGVGETSFVPLMQALTVDFIKNYAKEILVPIVIGDSSNGFQ